MEHHFAGDTSRVFEKSDGAEIEFIRSQIGISIADPINRRLVEGVAAQLGFCPYFLKKRTCVG